MPDRLKTLVAVLAAVGVLLVFDMIGPWFHGTFQLPVPLLYLAAAGVLTLRRPGSRRAGVAFAAARRLRHRPRPRRRSGMGAGRPRRVRDGEPLSQSPRDLAPYVLLVSIQWGLFEWVVSVLRRDEVRAHYDARVESAA